MFRPGRSVGATESATAVQHAGWGSFNAMPSPLDGMELARNQASGGGKLSSARLEGGTEGWERTEQSQGQTHATGASCQVPAQN